MSFKISKIVAGVFLCCIAVVSNAKDISYNYTYDEITYDNLQSYIESKNYPTVNLSESYGIFIKEKREKDYSRNVMTKFYRGKICRGLFFTSCNRNLSNIEKHTGINLNDEDSLFESGIYNVRGYKVSYLTPDMHGKPRQVSGAVIIPDSEKPLKGVVVMYHYTVLDKKNIPSNFNKDATHYSEIISATLASKGYAVVAPDYLGYGDDESSVHPYVLYPEVNALSGIYMLKGFESSFTKKLSFEKTKDDKIKLYMGGYSEGSAYALWAAKIFQENPRYLNSNGYKLIKLAPVSGAYNISKVLLDYLIESNEYGYSFQQAAMLKATRPGLFADVMSSYATYSLGGNESAVFSQKFANCDDSLVESGTCSISKLINNNRSELEKYNAILDAAKEAGYSRDNVSVLPLANPDILQNREFLAQLKYADIYNWKPEVDIDLITMEKDFIVPPLNTYTAYASMKEHGAKNVRLIMIPNDDFWFDGFIPFTHLDVNHPTFIPLSALFTRNAFTESAE
ncbi:MAG: lipase family protein [Burkholderiales bacterium]|nr:lipase family protein [Burkholderiales bacterium]